MRIGRIAGSVDLTTEAIRYYERLGLLEKSLRTDSGYRVYSPSALERVQFIKQAQGLGLSLDEIREVLRLKYSGKSPCDCVRNLLKKKLAHFEQQMKQMEVMCREIKRCLRVSRTSSRLPHEMSSICPLIQSKVSRRNSSLEGGEHR
jgi:DNA-binding transcriptional MerR regulator